MEYYILCPNCSRSPLRFIHVTDIDENDDTLYEVHEGKCFTCNKTFRWTRFYKLFETTPFEEIEDC